MVTFRQWEHATTTTKKQKTNQIYHYKMETKYQKHNITSYWWFEFILLEWLLHQGKEAKPALQFYPELRQEMDLL